MKKTITSFANLRSLKAKLFIYFSLVGLISNAQPNTWQVLSPPSITPVKSAISFGAGDDYFIGLGQDASSNFLNTLWKYNTIAGSWTSMANYPGTSVSSMIAEVVDGNAYVGLGSSNVAFYQFNPVTNTWITRANFPGTETNACASFVINGKIYVVGGRTGSTYGSKTYVYNPTTNAWSQLADITGGVRGYGQSFSIDGYGYVCMGLDASGTGTPLTSSYKYDPVSNTWSPITAFPTPARVFGRGFSICGKGYIYSGALTGNGGSFLNELYQYDPVANSWLQMASSSVARSTPMVAVVNDKMYACFGGNASGIINDLNSYNPPTIPCALSSINDLASAELVSISPNPSNGIISINSSNNCKLNVYNITGELILSKSINTGISEIQLDAKGLLYFVFQSDGQIQRFHKQVLVD